MSPLAEWWSFPRGCASLDAGAKAGSCQRGATLCGRLLSVTNALGWPAHGRSGASAVPPARPAPNRSVGGILGPGDLDRLPDRGRLPAADRQLPGRFDSLVHVRRGTGGGVVLRGVLRAPADRASQRGRAG